MSLARSVLSIFKQPTKPVKVSKYYDDSDEKTFKASTTCLDLCKPKILSDKGCEVIGPIKDGKAEVRCPVIQSKMNKTYDTVSNINAQDVCYNRYLIPKYIPCYKSQNKRLVVAVLFKLFFSDIKK
jgi:hypothetical protein